MKSLYKEEGKARKIKHIIKRHMIPVPKKKSYFLSRDVTYVTKLVKQTIFHPTHRVTHKSDRTKMVYIKNFSHVIGIHGLKRIQCYTIVAIVNASDNHLITAYPCLWKLDRLLSPFLLVCFGTQNVINKADYRVILDCCDYCAGAPQQVK